MLRTVELCKNFDGDIIHCCFWNDPKTLFHNQLRWYRFVAAEDTDQIPEIEPLNLPRYWRNTYSCVNDETLPLIKDHSRVYIAGVFTDISVAMTAMDVFDQGVPVDVVADCVATLHGPLVHENSLRSLGFAIGRAHLVQSHDLFKPARD